MDENDSLHASKSKWKMPLFVFFDDARLVFKMDSLAKEILRIAFPSALAVAADPIASLIDTAFIGHLGPVELAAAGASIALFNQASRITVFPLVSITTSFVAEEDTIEKINTIAAEKQFTEIVKANSNELMPDDHLLQDIEKGATKENSETPTESFAANGEINELMARSFVPENVDRDGTLKNETNNGDDTNTNICKSSSATSSSKSMSKAGRKKRHIASASTALLFGTILGLLQAATLIFAAKPLLGAMGLKHGSPMLVPAVKFLILRSLGAPAVLLSLVMQGIFRGFKDTTTPLYVIGGLVLARVVAVTFCVTLAASLAARLGSIPMAAFQTCLQVWLTSSLLADGLAVAVQAILARSFAAKDCEKVTAAAARTLQMGFVLGVGLSLVVGVGLYFGAGIFSKSILVVHLIRIGVPFVAATQPINSLAFVFDGVYYGASDFAYSAYSLVVVSLVSVASLFLLYKSNGFVGIWIGLTINMSLRMFVGVWRMGTGPWRFLRVRSLS